MKEITLIWQVGQTCAPQQKPAEMYPATVPGAAQLDYARAHNWPPVEEGVNFRDYAWMEDVYWLYTAPLDFTLEEDEVATLRFLGIDYRYRIQVGNQILAEGEGMFSPVFCDVTPFAGQTLEVLLWPVPKATDSNNRIQARKSCKAAACYGWDWHPRLVSSGLWDAVTLQIQPRQSLWNLDVSYRLSDQLDCCQLYATAAVHGDCRVNLQLLDGEEIVAEETQASCSQTAAFSLSIPQPKLWYPVGYGPQHRYTLRAQALDGEGNVLDVLEKKVGFRRAKLVMNAGSWDEPSSFPRSRSAAPITLEVNGRRLFAKGSNWVNAQLCPGQMTREHFDRLLTLAKDANMNILRIWGGGFVNPDSFFELCDEKGIMIWQEFPLSCNEYPNDPDYLAVLKKEAIAIVRKLRNHPCLVIWCGGNELFNNWSGMTDQHHALRLLNSVCYSEDPDTPFLMTSPLTGMGHGHYLNYDGLAETESITIFRHTTNTAYTEFGNPGAADPDYIKRFLSPEDYADCRPENDVWREHHAFNAWVPVSWLRYPEVEYYFGGWDDTDDVCRKTQFIQAMCYRSNFEEMRKQWPHCSMALNWCFNEPWPTFANNSLISWPDLPRPCYSAVKEALRPQLASLRIDRHLWWAGETFRADVWMLNDAPAALPAAEITVSYSLEDGPETKLAHLTTTEILPQTNLECGAIAFQLPEGFSGKFHIHLRVCGHPEKDSSYTYLCRATNPAPALKKRYM